MDGGIMSSGPKSFEHKIILGEGAGKWLPFARQKVALLHERARRLRMSALSQRFLVEGGDIEVAVRVVGDQRHIFIRRKECPTALNGFCDLRLGTDLVGTPFSPVYTVPNPNPPPATINVLRRFFPSPASPAGDRAWRDEPGLAKSTPAANQMVTLKASMFSGEMRKVVQFLQGMNVPISYSPFFALTHGVYKTAKGARWIVEVSNQGVVAWVMGTCNKALRNGKGKTVLEYTPISTPKPQDIVAAKKAGTFVELLAGTEIKKFYDLGGAFFSQCGWAFNKGGNRAANVCAGFEKGAVKSHLFELVISEVDDVPTTATLTKEKEGFINGFRDTHMKYPLPSGELYSFDPFYGTFSPFPSSGPVYVYYDGDDRQDFTYINSLESSTQVFSEGIVCVSTISLGKEFRVGSEITSAVPHFTTPAGPTNSTTVSSTGFKISKNVDEGHQGVQIVAGGYNRVRRILQHAWTRGQADLAFAVLLIPWGDREAVYIASTHSTTFSGQRIDYQDGFNAELSVHNFIDIEVCPITGGGPVIVQTLSSLAFPETLCPDGGVSYSGAVSYYPGFDIGDLITVASSIPPCTLTSIPAISSAPVILLPDPETHSTAKFVYVASGGVRRPLAIPSNFNAVMAFIEFFSQTISSIRDAFDPNKYVISPTVDVVNGDLCIGNKMQSYPLAEVNNPFYAYVGVP